MNKSYMSIATLLTASLVSVPVIASEIDDTELYTKLGRNLLMVGMAYEDHTDDENKKKFDNKKPYIKALIKPFKKSDFFYQLEMKNTVYTGAEATDKNNKDDWAAAVGNKFKFDDFLFKPRFEYRYITFGKPDTFNQFKLELNSEYKWNDEISFDIKPRYSLARRYINTRETGVFDTYNDTEWALQLGARYKFNNNHSISISAQHQAVELDGVVNAKAQKSRYNQDVRFNYFYKNKGYTFSPYIRAGFAGKQKMKNGDEKSSYTGRHGVILGAKLSKTWFAVADIYKQDYYQENIDGTLDTNTRDRMVYNVQLTRMF